MAAHLIHERKVDAFQVVVAGALDEKGVKGMVGDEERVGIIGQDLSPHLFLQPGERGDVGVAEVGQSQLNGQLFQCLSHPVGVEELLRRKRADDRAVARA